MANFGQLQLTQLGEDLQAKVQAGATLTFAYIALGSGIWSEPQDVNAMTALVNEETTIAITQVRSLGDGQWLVQGVIGSDDFIGHGYDHTECGIYATDPDLGDILYMATNATEPDHIPSNTEGVAYSTVLNFVQTISDQVTVTVTVDNASAATLFDLAQHEAKQLDPADTDPVIEKHVSNAQANGWEASMAANAQAIVRVTPIAGPSVYNSSLPSITVDGVKTEVITLDLGSLTPGDVGLVSVFLTFTKISGGGNTLIELSNHSSGVGNVSFVGPNYGYAYLLDDWIDTGKQVFLSQMVKFEVVNGGGNVLALSLTTYNGVDPISCRMDATWLYKQ